MIRTEIFDPPAWDHREIMRYARIRGADDSYRELIESCIAEAEPMLSYRVCYTILPVAKQEHELQFGTIVSPSQTIAKAVGDAEELLLFAATVGAPFDRLLHRYSLTSPAKALILQAIGAERVEALCDAFCDKINTELAAGGKALTRRVSPGYGDIPLAMQRDIFSILDCPRKIGLTLDDSLLMSPSKSVTAIAGIVRQSETKSGSKCALCDKADCAYRK